MTRVRRLQFQNLQRLANLRVFRGSNFEPSLQPVKLRPYGDIILLLPLLTLLSIGHVTYGLLADLSVYLLP